MTEIKGTNVSAVLCPFTTDDHYAVTDSQYEKGGWHEVLTIQDRDDIPTQRRTVGMAVYVTEENKLYILNDDLTTWTLFEVGNSNINDVKVDGTSVVTDRVANIDLTGKQDVIEDLEEIRSNAEAGKEASDTIATYGDVVTHNASDFATSKQGEKADTAIQPRDNVSELTNDADYQSGSQVSTSISEHNADNTAHSDIRTTLGNKQDKTDNALTTTAKTIVGAINELDARPAAPAIDSKTITKNTSQQLQTVAVIDQSNTNNILKEWSGTESAYQALSVKDSNTIYYTY